MCRAWTRPSATPLCVCILSPESLGALLQATKGDNVISLQKGFTLKGAKRKACFTLKADSLLLGL